MAIDVSEDQQYLLPAIEFLRINPTAYNAILFFFLAVAIVAASTRTGFRLYRFRTIEPDDILLIISTLSAAAGAAVAAENRDLSYLQMSISLGFAREPPADFPDRMATFQLLDDIGGILTWVSIFSVKLSFLLFFKKLVKRVRYLEQWWWVALSIVAMGLCVNVGLGFLICPRFGPQIIQTCTIEGMTHREGIYLVVTTVIDILTDVLIISVPIALLWRVKIDLRRKIALGTVCSLSAVMVALAVIRVTLAPVQSPVSPDIPPATDSLWLFVFQNVEASVAIVMVSITAFRSMLGQKGQSRPTKGSLGTIDPETGSNQLEKIPVKAAPQPAPQQSPPPQISLRAFGENALKQHEQHENLWTASKKNGVGKIGPTPPPKDHRASLSPGERASTLSKDQRALVPSRRALDSEGTYGSSGESNEELRQATPPRIFV